MISLITLIIVLVFIAFRQISRFRFQIWQIMVLGAVIVLVTGEISPPEAAKAIDIDVILFLFGVFIIGRALEESGCLASITGRVFGKAGSTDMMFILVIFSTGFLSAFLMNDTIAIIGTPLVLMISRNTGIPAKLLLLALAFAVTTGSIMSPVGNPQNLLVALHGDIANPFVTFFRYLFVPTLINLFAVYLVLRLMFRRHFQPRQLSVQPQEIRDAKLAVTAGISLGLLAGLILLKIVLVFTETGIDLRLTWIALASALPVLIFNRKRFEIIRHIDWSTLVFFAAMFILMASVWNSGYFQDGIDSLGLDISSNGTIMAVSILMSQFISNVPLVALYLPLLREAGTTVTGLMTLAAGSTIAGNLSILGAASNVIIIQNAERKEGTTLTFVDFIRAGIPLTLINAFVYWLFLLL